MPLGKKRTREEVIQPGKAKKVKFDGSSKPIASDFQSNLVSEEVDFPRGGGTSFTPLEYKSIRAEGTKEAEDEIFKDERSRKTKPSRRSKEITGKKKGGNTKDQPNETIRVEHLNYKRLAPGTRVLCQITAIIPLALIVSLPNQLMGHIPITQISSQLTQHLEQLSANDDDEEMADVEDASEADDSQNKAEPPELTDIFRVGQYIRAIVTMVRPYGAPAPEFGRARDELERTSRRVELSLHPDQVNAGVSKRDLVPGFIIHGAIKSIEDHGYILDFGIPDVSGFLSLKDAKKGSPKLGLGYLVDTAVVKTSENGRTCYVSVDPRVINAASLPEVTTVNSVLPGTLVQALITAIVPAGLNVQILGYFEGTIDLYQIGLIDVQSKFKIGQKIKARIIWDMIAFTPRKFALSVLPHIVALNAPQAKNMSTLQDAYPIGTILDSLKVVRVESEGGLVLELQHNVTGFVHISQVSDEHVPALSNDSGPWKIGTVHRGRVIGFSAFDGLLLVSLKPTVLEQQFLQVSDVHVGEVIKGTVKRLTDACVFVSISGKVDGVIWPNHYADIKLKHPEKRFKPGAAIKCRVLTVDTERKRISLTAKKTLIGSELPIISQFQDAQLGMVVHAVIFRVSERSLSVEFFNNVRAIIPLREASDINAQSTAGLFSVGQTVKVRVIEVDPDSSRITASIRQAAPRFEKADINRVAIGQVVEGKIAEVHQDNIVLDLQPTNIRALMSISNLANHRDVSVATLRTALEVGELLSDIVVVSLNLQKSLVIVANRPKGKLGSTPYGSLSIDKIEPGQILPGLVIKHGRHGASIRLSNKVFGSLHPTDTCDDYDAGIPFPALDSLVRAVVLEVDREKKHVNLSCRPSRLNPSNSSMVVDPEIKFEQLSVGESVRGFIKGIADQGVFVTIGRGVDARVQIRHLFDEFIKDWKPKFTLNQLVKGRIMSISPETKQIELTLRSGDVSMLSMPTRSSLGDYHVGQKVECTVKKIEDYGIFVGIKGTKTSGLCHKSEITDDPQSQVSHVLKGYRAGDLVKAIILSINLEKNQISFGLKPSYFIDADEEMEAFDNEDVGGGDNETESLGLADANPQADLDESEDEEVVEIEEAHETKLGSSSQTPALNGPAAPTLRFQGGFKWGTQDEDEAEKVPSDTDRSEDEDGAKIKKKKRRRHEIDMDLTANMHTKTPESTADFERFLLGSPNSSFLWIQFMSFQLQLSEIEKAREVGRRALQAINFREEQERLNVWIALLNLENTYGTEETLDATFKDAARHNDSKTVHLRLASIFTEAQKFDSAEQLFQKICKKFSQSSKVWTLFGEFQLFQGKLEEARQLLPRSLKSLDRRKHLKTISKFAQLEYKLGDPERGKTIFEGIVDSHPKRLDLWSVYVDMEASQSNIQSIRNIFDRALALKLSSKKAKFLFKKWLDLERKIGDESGAEVVKEKAIEWTHAAAGVTE